MISRLKRLLRSLGARAAVAPALAEAETDLQSTVPETIAFHAASTVRALERIVSRGLDVATVIDVGASNGMWSAAAMPVLPSARYLLVEAQEGHRVSLDAYVGANPNAQYVLAAAGDADGEVYFNDGDLLGGVAYKEKNIEGRIRVPMISVDAELARRGLEGPYLLKLDTHGFEVPILNGADQALKNASLVVIEAYNFRILPDSLLFHELCAFMAEKGFSVIDVSEPMWRIHDRAFWQFDIFFVPSSRPEFSYVSYA